MPPICGWRPKRSTAVKYGAQLSASGVVVGDVNGDGKPDLAVTYDVPDTALFENEKVAVLLGQGDGTFRAAV